MTAPEDDTKKVTENIKVAIGARIVSLFLAPAALMVFVWIASSISTTKETLAGIKVSIEKLEEGSSVMRGRLDRIDQYLLERRDDGSRNRQQ